MFRLLMSLDWPFIQKVVNIGDLMSLVEKNHYVFGCCVTIVRKCPPLEFNKGNSLRMMRLYIHAMIEKLELNPFCIDSTEFEIQLD